MGVEERTDVAGDSSRHKRSSSSRRKERKDSTKEATPPTRVRSHSVADLPPGAVQLEWAEGDNAGSEKNKSKSSTRVKHESGKERERRASRSRRDKGDELDKQNSCSESSSSSTGGTPLEESKKGKKDAKKIEDKPERSGASKRSKRASRSPRSRKDGAGKAKRDSKRQSRSTIPVDGGRPASPSSPSDAVVIRTSASPRRLSDPEISPRKPESTTKKRHQRRSSDSSDGERVAERSVRAERREKARAEREPKRMRVRRMASYNDSLKSGSSDDEDEPEHKASPFLGRKTRKGARKHSRSMSSENLLKDAWDGGEQPQAGPGGMDPLLHKRISDQARERRKNSRAAQLNHSDIAVALSSSLAKVKEDRAPNRRMRAGTSLSRIHKHKPHQQDTEASEAFTQALVSSESGLLVAVCRSEADLAYGGSPELLRHILDLLACEDELEDFVAWFLRQELEETASSSLVFRGVSIASVLFAGHFFYEAGAYVRETVLPLVTHVCSFGRSWEVNPAAVDEDTDVKANTERISTLFEGFLDKVFGKNHHLPASVARLFLLTRDLISSRFADENIDAGRMLLGFFFLRFLCPVIIAPDRFGLAAAPPDSKARRGLVIISKLLQNLANGTEFDYSKEVYMCGFNDVLAKYRSSLPSFADELVTCTETPPPTPERLSPAMRSKSVQFIFAHVQSSFASVWPLCKEATQALLDREFPEMAKLRESANRRSSLEESRPATEEKKSRRTKKKSCDAEQPPALQTQESSEEVDGASHLSVLKELLRGETQARFAAEEQLKESQTHNEKLQAAAATLCGLVERLGGSVPEDIKVLTSSHP